MVEVRRAQRDSVHAQRGLPRRPYDLRHGGVWLRLNAAERRVIMNAQTTNGPRQAALCCIRAHLDAQFMIVNEATFIKGQNFFGLVYGWPGVHVWP